MKRLPRVTKYWMWMRWKPSRTATAFQIITVREFSQGTLEGPQTLDFSVRQSLVIKFLWAKNPFDDLLPGQGRFLWKFTRNLMFLEKLEHIPSRFNISDDYGKIVLLFEDSYYQLWQMEFACEMICLQVLHWIMWSIHLLWMAQDYFQGNLWGWRKYSKMCMCKTLPKRHWTIC